MDRAPLVAEALEFQKFSAEAYGNQRERENDDLEFQVPEKQWPEDVRVQRGGQTVQGVPIPARPMLSIPKLDQPIQLTYNQWLHAHYGVQIHPLNTEADDDTAKMLQGLYRSIEVDSRANLARGWGADRALKAGFGAYRVDVVYDDCSDDPDDLKVVIKRLLRQSSVYWDPFAQEPDFSDQTRNLIVSFMSRSSFKRQFKDAALAGMSSDDLLDLQSQMPNWARLNGTGQQESGQLKWYDGGNDTVCVAEYFYTVWEEREVGGRRKTRKVPVIKWAKINAVEVLEEATWNGKYIPIIPCIGKELQPFDEERRWTGMIGPNKDSARLFNYEVSDAVEKGALATKAPWIGPVGSFRTNQAQWQLANVRNLPYLEYDPISIAGTLAERPSRNLESPDLSSQIALIQIANENIQAGTYTFDETLGKNTRQKSGKAVEAIQGQADLSQSNYLANMADISMTYEAKVIIDLICGDKNEGRSGVYDRPGRIAHLLGEDDSRRPVMLNAPFVAHPTTGHPMPAPTTTAFPPPSAQPGSVLGLSGQQTQAPKVMHYDLQKGKYGVVVSVGKSYQTRSQEGSDALSNIMAADPNLTVPLLPVWAKFQDFPGHDEVLEIAKKMQPPQLQNKDEPNPQQAQQQLAQQGQMIQALTAQLQHATELLKTDAIKVQGQVAIANAKGQIDLQKTTIQEGAESERAEKDREKDITIAEISALAKELQDTRKLFMEERARIGSQVHESAMGAADAGHDQHMAELGQQHAMENAAAGVAGQSVLADQGHQQALEQGQQAAALAPQPEAGA